MYVRVLWSSDDGRAVMKVPYRINSLNRGGNFQLKVGGAESSANAGDPMLGVAVIP